jgi:iron(III) transport system permease protein
MAAKISHQSNVRHRLGQVLGYSVIAFTFVFLFLFLVLPVSMIIIKAFMGPDGFTFEYFKLLFANEIQTTAIQNSLMIGVATTICCTMLTIPLALVQTKFNFPLKTLLSGLLLTPMVMPPFVGAIGIQRFFARRGSVNLFLMDMGIIETPIEWLGQDSMFWAVVILETLHLYPILYLNLTAAMANVDPSLEEMAATLGTNRWQRFKDVIWPLARPGYFAGAIIVFIWALTDLGTPLLTGFHETMPVRIFNMVTDVHDNPVGYALVFLVILLTVAIFLASKYLIGGKKYEMLARGHVGDHTKQLGWISGLPCYMLFLGVSLVALFPHIAVIITSISDKWFMTVLPEAYTLQHYAQIFKTDLPLIGIENSLLLASLSTVFDLVMGLLIAYVVVRKLTPGAQILDSLVMLPLALPGIVLAFGYVVTYTNTFLDPMNNPIPLLVIAYGIRRLPYMVRSAAAGLQQTSASLEEASATFGASRLHTMRKITIPLVMANLIAGSLLCFAYAMLDVSDSLILAMKDQFYPLTKAIYALFLEHGSGELIASALGVVSMGILGGCIMAASLLLGKKMGELFRSG